MVVDLYSLLIALDRNVETLHVKSLHDYNSPRRIELIKSVMASY